MELPTILIIGATPEDSLGKKLGDLVDDPNVYFLDMLPVEKSYERYIQVNLRDSHAMSGVAKEYRDYFQYIAFDVSTWKYFYEMVDSTVGFMVYIAMMLKPGGKIYIPNTENMGTQIHVGTHRREYTLNTKEILERIGLRLSVERCLNNSIHPILDFICARMFAPNISDPILLVGTKDITKLPIFSLVKHEQGRLPVNYYGGFTRVIRKNSKVFNRIMPSRVKMEEKRLVSATRRVKRAERILARAKKAVAQTKKRIARAKRAKAAAAKK